MTRTQRIATAVLTFSALAVAALPTLAVGQDSSLLETRRLAEQGETFRLDRYIVTHVEPGETLSEIAARYGVSVDALQRWNRIENPDLVLVGQRIVVYEAGSWDVWIGGAIVLALLLFLLRRKRGAAPQVNDGERMVGSELMRHYRDWILINDVLLPSGQGTTQIDHILVSPSAVFLIETKEMNGWVFGSPGQKHWAQSFAAGRRSRKVGIRSKQFKFYNPLLQNEGHAKALVNLGIVDRWRIRPIVVFVGDAQLKTAGKFLPFDEHEKMASKNSTWRMRGVICMSLANLHRYIAFSVNAPSNPGLTLQKMEMICAKIRAAEIPMTAESHAKHVDFVQSVKEMESR